MSQRIYRVSTNDGVISEYHDSRTIHARVNDLRHAGFPVHVHAGWIEWKEDFLLDDPSNIERLNDMLHSKDIEAREIARLKKAGLWHG